MGEWFCVTATTDELVEAHDGDEGMRSDNSAMINY
jgi:hypothetical protein